MGPQGAAPRTGIQGGGSIGGGEARIIAFRPRQAPHECASCGYPLTGRPAWWHLCLQCFRGAQLYRATQIFLGRRN